MNTTKCGWLLASNLIAIACCATYWNMVGNLEGRIKTLEAEAAALQACLPQADGEIAALARRNGELECAITARSKQGRRVVSRQTFKT